MIKVSAKRSLQVAQMIRLKKKLRDSKWVCKECMYNKGEDFKMPTYDMYIAHKAMHEKG